MPGTILIAALLAGAAPPPPASGEETAIPRIRNFIEWVADGKSAIYIRGDTGKWYHARTRGPCARLRPHISLSFVGATAGQLDRYGAIVAEGWRCQLASVVRSGPPPGYGRRHAAR